MVLKSEFDVFGLIVRIVLTGVIVAVSLNIAGCNEQMARIEENQLILQTLAKNNAKQIAAIEATIEKNQKRLEASIENVQNGTQKVAVNLSAVGDAQIKLHNIVQENNRQLANKVVAVEHNQYELQTQIEEVRSDTQKVAADVAAVGGEQLKLYETLQNNNRHLTNKVAAIEQNQQKWQDTIEGIQMNIQRLTAGMSALEQNLLKLQEIFQNKIREFVSMMDVNSQRQLEFQESVQKDLEALTDSVNAVEQSQAKLQKRILDVQSSTGIMSNHILEALEKLKQEQSREGPVEPAEMMDIEPILPFASSPSEINSAE